MKQVDFRLLEELIRNRKDDVELRLLAEITGRRSVRTRPRDPEEQVILDQIAIQKWREAERAGKIKYISKTEWHYEL